MTLDFEIEDIIVPACRQTYKWSDKVVITEEDYELDQELRVGTLRLPSSTVTAMLNALPEGVKWNPYTERFEKDGESIY